MKLVKMSLAAAMLMSASVYAIDNVKVNGDAKLYYSTDNTNKANTPSDDLFGKASSQGDTALRVGVTGDLHKNISFGATFYAVSTLGLENNLVGQTWSGNRNGLKDSSWMGEAWIAGTAGNTTAKVGRMELDTPLVFSEKWSVTPNTFTGAAVINKDLPDTTLVGAWIGQGNGLNAAGTDNNNSVGWDYMGNDFGTFNKSGAYAAGAINNSFKPLVAQAWYYNVATVAEAYWLQADWDCQLLKDVKLGAQYAHVSPNGSTNDTRGYAVKAAYEGVKDLVVSAAYSSVDEDSGDYRIANFATDNTGRYGSPKFAAQSKLYTEAWWSYGYVGQAGADTVTLAAAYDAGFAKLYAQHTDINILARGETTTSDVTETTVTASKTFGPLDATLAYIATDDENVNGGRSYDTVMAMLQLNF